MNTSGHLKRWILRRHCRSIICRAYLSRLRVFSRYRTLTRLERCSPRLWHSCEANPIVAQKLWVLQFASSRRILLLALARLCASTQAVRKSPGLDSSTPCAIQARGKLLLRSCMSQLRMKIECDQFPPNQSSDPTLASGTSAAEQSARRPLRGLFQR
jgi:hypothetical protein